MKRVDETRIQFKKIWIEESLTGLLDALGWYHEKKDKDRNIGLGPSHDWASHSCDSFGLMCIVYEEPKEFAPLKYNTSGRA